jgi:hypothetical protein
MYSTGYHVAVLSNLWAPVFIVVDVMTDWKTV